MKIGVLALQGAIKEHIDILRKCNAEPVAVKAPEDFDNIGGLIIPGGESTTIGKLIERNGLEKEIKRLFQNDIPIYGSCAGAILMAKKILGSSQLKLKLMDISIKRNDYGRQVDSFETDLYVDEIGKFRGVFIRAPVINEVFNGAKIMGSFKEKPVIVRQGNLLVTTFHPELTNDIRIHKYFVGMVKERAQKNFPNLLIA